MNELKKLGRVYVVGVMLSKAILLAAALAPLVVIGTSPTGSISINWQLNGD